MRLKNLLLITVSSAAIVTAAHAIELTSPDVTTSDLKVKLSGFSHFQIGSRFQDNLTEDEKLLSSGKENPAFFNQSGFCADFENSYQHIHYGMKVVLVPTAKRKGGGAYNGSHIFLESKFGKIDIGSPISASTKMMMTGTNNSTVGFSEFFRYSVLNSAHIKQNGMAPSFVTYSESFLDDRLASSVESISYSSEPARSVSYYTPKFNLNKKTAMQVGITYIPDSSNTGISGKPSTISAGIEERRITKEAEAENGDIAYFKIDHNVKDAFSAGLCLEQNFAEGVDLKIGATGEYGKSIGKAKRYTWEITEAGADGPAKTSEKLDKEFDLTDMVTYNIGAQLTAGSFSFAASYGSTLDSLTTEEFHKNGRETNYFAGGVAYQNSGFGLSLSYFKSDKFKNILTTYSVGTNYLLAPGFKPYAGIFKFTTKGKPEYYPDLESKETSGTVALIGAKLSL